MSARKGITLEETNKNGQAGGPLAGYRVIELAGLGPAPLAGMMFADLGAEVVLVDRKAGKHAVPECTLRGKRSIVLNLKDPADIERLLNLIEKADVLIEGFRPGVAERLGFGPDEALKRNPKMVFGRMTGWGQSGPLAHSAGHDINYISLTGALHGVGHAGERPTPPLNLVGDYGGGTMFLVSGVLAALLEAQRSGQGQVVDAAMTDGSAVLMAMFHSMHAQGHWQPVRGANLLDSGAPFYDTYETADGEYMSVGPLEPQFFAELIDKLGLDPGYAARQYDPTAWAQLRTDIGKAFKTRSRDEWRTVFEGSDACVAPVLNFLEAAAHPHNAARQTYVDVDGMTQPAPAPRFSRTPTAVRFGSRPAGADTEAVLADWGIE